MCEALAEFGKLGTQRGDSWQWREKEVSHVNISWQKSSENIGCQLWEPSLIKNIYIYKKGGFKWLLGNKKRVELGVQFFHMKRFTSDYTTYSLLAFPLQNRQFCLPHYLPWLPVCLLSASSLNTFTLLFPLFIPPPFILQTWFSIGAQTQRGSGRQTESEFLCCQEWLGPGHSAAKCYMRTNLLVCSHGVDAHTLLMSHERFKLHKMLGGFRVQTSISRELWLYKSQSTWWNIVKYSNALWMGQKANTT